VPLFFFACAVHNALRRNDKITFVWHPSIIETSTEGSLK
jgi:hypothetical protein